MTDETFEEVIKFIKRTWASGTLIVSGGEPMEHPKFWDMIHRLSKELNNRVVAINVTTNGTEIFKDFERFEAEFPTMENVYWQITRVPGLYPEEIKKDDPVLEKLNKLIEQQSRNKLSRIYTEFEMIAKIYPQGRALENDLWTRGGTYACKCFNIRSVALHCQSFNSVVGNMVAIGKYCVPCIEYNGSIKLGESKLCPACSHVSRDDMHIMNDIRAFKCKACKEAIANIPKTYVDTVLGRD